MSLQVVAKQTIGELINNQEQKESAPWKEIGDTSNPQTCVKRDRKLSQSQSEWMLSTWKKR